MQRDKRKKESNSTFAILTIIFRCKTQCHLSLCQSQQFKIKQKYFHITKKNQKTTFQNLLYTEIAKRKKKKEKNLFSLLNHRCVIKNRCTECNKVQAIKQKISTKESDKRKRRKFQHIIIFWCDLLIIILPQVLFQGLLLI